MSPLYIVTNGDGGNCFVYKPSQTVSRAASAMLQTFLIIAKRSVEKYKLSGKCTYLLTKKENTCTLLQTYVVEGVFRTSEIVSGKKKYLRWCSLGVDL
jgi:hypothetical protein